MESWAGLGWHGRPKTYIFIAYLLMSLDLEKIYLHSIFSATHSRTGMHPSGLKRAKEWKYVGGWGEWDRHMEKERVSCQARNFQLHLALRYHLSMIVENVTDK